MATTMIKSIKETLRQLKKENPIVLCLTNYVTMDFMANTLLAIGAAPIMSVAVEELEEMTAVSHAVNVNIGTLDAQSVERYQKAAEYAKRNNKICVLDPVGAGSSRIRTNTARLLMHSADIIRGNASEIIALTATEEGRTRGVDTQKTVNSAANSAKILAKILNNVIVVSGPVDLVTNGQEIPQRIPFGSPLMTHVSGMGCVLNAVIAAFAAVAPTFLEAAAVATTYFDLCASLAQHKNESIAPGTFRAAFIDELYAADFNSMEALALNYNQKKEDAYVV